MLVIMSWQRYNILLEKAKKFIFFSNHFDSDISREFNKQVQNYEMFL